MSTQCGSDRDQIPRPDRAGSDAEPLRRDAGSPDPSSGRDLTELLHAWQQGDEWAEAEVLDRIYPHLRKIAARSLSRHARRPTLQITELVHETYLKLMQLDGSGAWESREHFFNFAGKAMRRLLIDLARRRAADKRRLPESDLGELEPGRSEAPIHPDLLDLDAALLELVAIDELAVKVVELRYFAGLSVEETSCALGVGRTTVVRRWRYARSWLSARLDPDGG